MSSSSYRSGGMGSSDYDSYGGGGGRGRDRGRDDYDSYRSSEGGTGRRGGGYGGSESNGGRREDRYSREGYGDEDRPRGRGGRDFEGGGDYKQDGYSHAGGTALQDDDDFEPRCIGHTALRGELCYEGLPRAC